MSDASEPVIEAPAAEAVDPVVEAPAAEVVEPVVVEGADPVVEPAAVPETVDPYEAYGGKEAIEAAQRMYQAAATEDGVIQLFLESGRSLGLGLKDLQALFTELGADLPEPPDPDEPITRREFDEMTAKQQQAEADRQTAKVTEAARQAVRDTVTALGLDPEDSATTLILQLGDKHLKGDLTPSAVAAAVRQGHADYQAQIEKEAQAYLAKKVAQGAAVPSAPAGAAAPSEPAPAEHQDVATAIKAARKALGLAS